MPELKMIKLTGGAFCPINTVTPPQCLINPAAPPIRLVRAKVSVELMPHRHKVLLHSLYTDTDRR